MRAGILLVAWTTMGLVACGGSHGSSQPNTITISGYAFSPSNLTVAPGTTVTVVNNDSAQHSVTSQSAAGSFTPGPVNGVQFDTGVFTGTRTFTIPASAPTGTVVPYFCVVHGSMMANTGQITIH